MSKVFISGSDGAIGQFLVSKLKDLNHLVLVQDKKFRIQEDAYFEHISNPESIDTFYHLAAKSFVPDSWKRPAEFLETNVLGTQKVIDFCLKNSIRLVFISSYAYGKPDYLPIDEKHPVKWANPYGMTKMMAEELCIFNTENSGLNCTIVRPFNIYGTLANEKLLIPEIVAQVRAGGQIKVRDLEPKRDYIFIDDLVDFLGLLVHSSPNQIYNLGTGVSLSVKEIIDMCQKVWGTNLNVVSDDTQRKNEIPETRCDISRAERDFQWQPKIDFEAGLMHIKDRMDA